MKRLKVIPKWMLHYAVLLGGMSLLCTISISLKGQSKYDIRLSNQTVKEDATKVCWEVQIQSANPNSWELAGQNYRLYYDASNISFLSGSSLLGSKYQAFNLVQDAQHIDASEVGGVLPFEADLGFLNYAIDLLNPGEAGTIVPEDGTWLSTTQLCFSVTNLTEQDSLRKFDVVWARNGKTDKYARSFVEISTRIGVNQTETSVGDTYFDLNNQDENQENKVLLKAKAFLQGSFDKETGLMHDKIRALNLIPLAEPYSSIKIENDKINFKSLNGGNEKTTAAVLEISGKNAIVDWVFLEIRAENDSSQIIMTQAALIQRDGDIVGTDGVSALEFTIPPAAYYVCLRHRNHLGIMTAAPIQLNKLTKMIDFTQSSTPVFGTYARKQEGAYQLLWGGNADSNRYLIFQGAGVSIPDTDKIFFDIFLDERNVDSRFNFISKGYFLSDLNMDGEVRYQGGDNELSDILFFNVFSHPNNINFFTNFLITEQIPLSTE